MSGQISRHAGYNTCKQRYNYHEAYKKRLRKKRIKQQKMARLRFFTILFLILLFALPKIFINTYNHLFINRIKNSAIKIPEYSEELYDQYFTDSKFFPDAKMNFLNKTNKYLANNLFLDHKTIKPVSGNESRMMKPIEIKDSMHTLTHTLNYLAKQYSSIEPGIFIWDFATGNYVSINGDKQFATASIIKISILLELFKQIEKGDIHLSQTLPMHDFEKAIGSGSLQYLKSGTSFSVKNLAQLMIRSSDNTASNMLLYKLGGSNELNKAMRQWGLNKSYIANWLPDLKGTNVSTPKEIATMLYNIEKTNFLDFNSKLNIIKIMSKVRNTSLIRAGIPRGSRADFYHKTGDIGSMLGDAGVVTMPSGRKYIIVIMANRPWNSYSAKQFIIKASRRTYNAFLHNNM